MRGTRCWTSDRLSLNTNLATARRSVTVPNAKTIGFSEGIPLQSPPVAATMIMERQELSRMSQNHSLPVHPYPSGCFSVTSTIFRNKKDASNLNGVRPSVRSFVRLSVLACTELPSLPHGAAPRSCPTHSSSHSSKGFHLDFFKNQLGKSARAGGRGGRTGGSGRRIDELHGCEQARRGLGAARDEPFRGR